MTARKFLIERARGCGLKVIKSTPDHITLAPLGIFPPPNPAKLAADISRYGFSFKPAFLAPGIIFAFPPEGGFDIDMVIPKAEESEYVIKLPWEIVSKLPEWRPPRPGEIAPSIGINPPRKPRTIWPPKELAESPTVERVIDEADMKRMYGKVWPLSEIPIKRQVKTRIKSFKEVGNLLVIRNTNQKGEGTVKLYGYRLPAGRYFQLASRSVLNWGEADMIYNKAIEAMKKGGF